MALQSSGQISYSDIQNEFGSPGNGGMGAYRVSQSVGTLNNLPLDSGIPQSGQISFSQFYGKRLNCVTNLYSGSTDYRINARTIYNNSTNNVTCIGNFRTRPSNPDGKRHFININKTFGSAKSGNKFVAAVRTGTWGGSSTVSVDIGGSGRIFGAGGNGGNGRSGASDQPGFNGGNGTTALAIEHNGTVVNHASGALVTCGFAGGGGGGSSRQEDSQDRTAGGGGGGGGAGLPAGSGSTGGNSGSNNDEVRGGAGGGSGSTPNLNATREGGGGGNGGNNKGEAVGGNGGRGGDTEGGPQNGGQGRQTGEEWGQGGLNGSNGCAISKASGISWSFGTQSGTVVGTTNETGVA